MIAPRMRSVVGMSGERTTGMIKEMAGEGSAEIVGEMTVGNSEEKMAVEKTKEILKIIDVIALITNHLDPIEDKEETMNKETIIKTEVVGRKMPS